MKTGYLKNRIKMNGKEHSSKNNLDEWRKTARGLNDVDV